MRTKIFIILIILISFRDAFSKDIDGNELSILIDKWLNERKIESNFNILNEIKYPGCDEIIINNVSINYSLIKVSCFSPNKWSFIVRNKLKRLEKITKKVEKKKFKSKIFVLKSDFKKGKFIHKDDIRVLEREVKNNKNLVLEINDIIGKKTKRHIRANREIYYAFLEKDWMIKKQSEILIENSIGMLSVKVKGIALEDADYMEKIRVKNISSGEILTGYVENKKKVLIRPKQF